MEGENRLQNFDLVLPNIELRVDHFVTSRSGQNPSEAVEMHVIFSDDLDPITIRENFVNQLEAKTPEGNTIHPTRANLERLGDNPDFESFDDYDDPYVAGCNRITVDADTIYDALDKEVFEGKYLTTLVETGWEKISWKGRSGTLRGNLLSRADAVFISNSDTRDWLLGRTEKLPSEKFKRMFGALNPALRGSDTHAFEDFCTPDANRYCWIKADTTFEGLKQIKYEPAGRVWIGETSPQRRLSIHTPTEVRIQNGDINDRLSISDTILPLNPNLVTVIGGKGAGKTALLDLIANCYQNRHLSDSDEEIDFNSFIQRIQEDEPVVTTEIAFHGSDIGPFEKAVLEDELVNHSDVEYLPQGKIAEYCRDEDRMHDQVLDLIQQSVRRSDPDLMERFEQKHLLIQTLEDSLEELTNRIHEYDPATIQSRINKAESELKTAEGKLEDKKREIEEFRSEHGEDLEDNPSTKYQEQLDDLEAQIQTLHRIEARVSDQLERLDVFQAFNSELDEIQSLAEEAKIDFAVDKIDLDRPRSALNHHAQSVTRRLTELKEHRDGIRDELEELEDIDQEFSQLLTEQRERKNEVEEKRDTVSELVDVRDTVDELSDERTETFIKYVKSYHDLKNLYSLVISEFAKDQSTILEDIRFDADMEVVDGLQSRLYDLLDGRSVNVSQLSQVMSAAERSITETDQIEHYAQKYIDEALSFHTNLLENASRADFEQRIFGENFKLSEQILLDETKMDDLSLGQKGTVLLKLLLAQDEKPLLIDQPEENLDNRFIYRTLKDAFKEAKKKRQVIIATHNANLVVNTDAEQVVVANYDENEISFISGPLEDGEIRTEVTTILEGGKQAFMQREEKYGLAE
jgi:ABC-type cobalamin/Fe3+-siderophores transport system ATPase subunit